MRNFMPFSVVHLPNSRFQPCTYFLDVLVVTSATRDTAGHVILRAPGLRAVADNLVLEAKTKDIYVLKQLPRPTVGLLHAPSPKDSSRLLTVLVLLLLIPRHV
jgi:hypothetical protein